MKLDEYREWLKQNPSAKFTIKIDSKEYDGEELQLPEEGVGDKTCIEFEKRMKKLKKRTENDKP